TWRTHNTICSLYYLFESLLSLPRIFFFSLLIPPPPTSTLFPYTTLFRSPRADARRARDGHQQVARRGDPEAPADAHAAHHGHRHGGGDRTRGSEGAGTDERDEGAGPRCRPPAPHP